MDHIDYYATRNMHSRKIKVWPSEQAVFVWTFCYRERLNGWVLNWIICLRF